MTEKSSTEEGVSRREFMVAAVVGGAIGSTPAAEAVAANEICRIDAVTRPTRSATRSSLRPK